MSKTPFSQSPEVITSAGEKFVRELYYHTMDKKREEIQLFYLDGSVMIWNGVKIAGKTQIANFFAQLASTTHEIDTIDVQPSIISSNNSQKIVNILVTVTGHVEYGGDRSTRRLFSQYFLLVHGTDNVYYIANDTFRWLVLGKPPFKDFKKK